MINKKFLELEEINIDFPIKINESRILFSLIDNKIGFSGFVICEETTIVKKIFLKNTIIIGEPQIINIENTNFAISFSKKHENNFLLIVNLDDYSYFEVPIPISLINGFHSIFINN